VKVPIFTVVLLIFIYTLAAISHTFILFILKVGIFTGKMLISLCDINDYLVMLYNELCDVLVLVLYK